MEKEITYVLKRVKDDMTAYGGFQYPEKGMVEAPDWSEDEECGGGLHGLEYGAGDFDIEQYGNTWLIIKVNKADGFCVLDDGKVKFKKGEVVLCTKDKAKAINFIKKKAPKGTKINYDFSSENNVAQGYYSTATQGDYSTATQGDCSTAKQGDYSTAKQGNDSTAKQGDYSTAKQGNDSTAKQGDYSTAKQGNDSTAKQGDYSTATQGYYSTATQGYGSTATQGDYSTATQGYGSTATQGHMGVMIVKASNLIYKCKGKLSTIIMFINSERHLFLEGIDFSQGETIYIKNCKIEKKYTTTPERIDKIEEHEIFVFGSNLNGHHIVGSALQAKNNFQAKEGVGEGLTGQSYAFPTLNKKMEKRTLKDITASFESLYETARKNTTKIFLLTKVGCGIAGFTEEEMISALPKNPPANIIFPKNWIV